MMRKLLLALLISTAIFAQADIPTGYYTGISGLTDSALKTKLHEIISKHSTNSYSGLFSQSFRYTDVRDDGSWWDMYSNNLRYVRNGWSGMNREHSFPKSWWGGGEDVPAYTDLNHLYPSDGDANLAKNNYPLGEVNEAGVTFDNGLVKVGYPVSGQGGGSRYVFEPADEYKGDFARTYFYMVTCYQDLTWKYHYIAQDGAYPTLQGWAIDMLLEWHRNDPVSPKETERNDEVYRLQYNRNPFIDYPNLAEYIWGTMKGKPFTDADLPPIGEGTLIAPENKSTVEFGDVVRGYSSTMTINIRGRLTANLSLRITGANASDFSIPTTTVPWAEVNDAGYELKVTYAPKQAGESNATLLLYDGGMVYSSFVVNLTGTAHEPPVFDRITATEATRISPEGFQANWQTPANPSTVDWYVVNVTEYTDGSLPQTASVTTDGTEPYFYYTNITPGATYSYTVQSVRFGMESEESNVINVDPQGAVSGIEASRPLAVAPISSGIRFICQERHTDVRITDMTGRVVRILPSVDNGQCVLLPFGAYIVSSPQCHRPLKILVKD